jgi:uncharacterized membrane protein (GlpM family)
VNYIEALVRFIVGGLFILLISYIGKTKNAYLAGMAMLFPMVTVVGYYFLSLNINKSEMPRVVLTSLLSLPTTAAFLLTLYFIIDKMPIIQALLLGLLSWVAVGVCIILFDRYFLNRTL